MPGRGYQAESAIFHDPNALAGAEPSRGLEQKRMRRLAIRRYMGQHNDAMNDLSVTST
jgi:hypothetical protein